jgi:hypothetical protein
MVRPLDSLLSLFFVIELEGTSCRVSVRIAGRNIVAFQALGGGRDVRRDRQAHGLDLLNQASQRMSVSDLADADQKRL